MSSTTGSTPFVLCRADIESASHYRTTLKSAAEAPVYITLVTDDHWVCNHPSAVSLTRFGEATCHGCGAQMFSLRWLAEGVFGPGTVEFGANEVKRMHEAMRGQGVIVIDTKERQIIEAMGVEQAFLEDMDSRPAFTVSAAEFEQIEASLAEEPKVIPSLAEFLRDHGAMGPMPTPHAEPPTEVVAALENPDLRANTRRSGVPVPPMVLVDHDWQPDPAA